LQSKGSVTFTDIWEAVSIAFPNSLTSDQSSIKSTLEDYARPVAGGNWMIKQNFHPNVVEKEHSTVMALLAEIGRKRGYKIYIGKVEQSHKIYTSMVKKHALKDYINYPDLSRIKNAENIDIVKDIDLLWIKDHYIKYAFEIEATTSMTSALLRGSNIIGTVSKVMLFPSDRYQQYERKMKSPMFRERVEADNWKFILFEELYQAWSKKQNETLIEEITNLGIKKRRKVDQQMKFNLE
jgi:hypothetical protein